MPRPAPEVADIFRDHGAAWRAANAGHVSLGQLKVMSAIEDCRLPLEQARSLFEVIRPFDAERAVHMRAARHRR
jgi:hypothetical protein